MPAARVVCSHFAPPACADPVLINEALSDREDSKRSFVSAAKGTAASTTASNEEAYHLDWLTQK